MRSTISFLVVGVVFGSATVSFQARAAEADNEPAEPASARAPLSQQTMSKVPSGLDTYTAMIDHAALGAAGVGVLESRPQASGSVHPSGGLRVWGGLLGRAVVQADVGEDGKGRFSPAVTAAVRVLGDRKRGWAAGVLARYRTEGFSTVDGEVEGGLLGTYSYRQLHVDLGLLTGAGVEEEEADGEALLRFGYDLVPVLRLGLEARARRELAEGRESEMRALEGERDEWDAFAGAQATIAFDRFFACLTAGPQKVRLSEGLGWMAQLTVGGVQF